MASKRQMSKAAARRRSHARESGSARGNSSASTKKTGCPIVGVGGSAGGFEAAMELLRHLPAKNGMAFVIVQHLDPHHASRLAALLGRVTHVPAIEVTGTTVPGPHTVYVTPR